MLFSRRNLALLILSGLAAAACTEQADVVPATTAFVATTTTTVPAVESTTTAPETTLAPDTTAVESTTTVPETTVSPTTTIAATGNPTTVSTEYFLGGDANGWLYLGRWTGNAWETDRDENQQLREPAATAGDDLIAHELDVAPQPSSIEGSGAACAVDGRIGPVVSPAATSPESPAVFQSIAFPADWSTEPRPVALVDANVASYVEAGQAAFDDFGIDTSSGAIEQLVVADLDGDGDTEALVAFDGDGFSALLLIDADSGASTTVARSVEATVTPTTLVEGDEPGEATTTPANTFRTLAVADLNGDGRFEFVMQSIEDDSAAVTAYAYDSSEVNPVLTAGC